MDKNFLIEKYLEVIKICNNNDMGYNWEDSEYSVNFIENKTNCEFTFARRFFGLYSYIHLRISEYGYSYRITRDEYKILRGAYLYRENELKSKKANSVFPGQARNKKITDIINDADDN